MSWSRFDDLYDEHEKIESAWDVERATVGLHVMATTACNRWLSDGVIRPRWLMAKLPERKERDRVLAAMVDLELFDVLAAGETRVLRDADGEEVTVGPFADDRYIVHDFLDRHDSSVQIKAKRDADAARKRAGRRKDSNRTPRGVRPDVQPESERTAPGPTSESTRSPAASRARPRVAPAPASLPIPTQTTFPPSPPKGGRKRDRESFEEAINTYVRDNFPGQPVGLIEHHATILRRNQIEPTVDAIQAILDDEQQKREAAAA